jgi:MCM N-terminal domain
MDGLQLRDEAVRDRIRAATEFLDPTDARARSYRADIVLMLNRGLRRLVVSIDDVRAHNRELADGLLFFPFDHVQVFDQALKDVVKTLPNRPAKETSDEAVRSVSTTLGLRLRITGLLLRLLRQLRRKCLQSTNPGVKFTQSLGVVGGHCHKMLAREAQSGQERALE